MVMFVCSAEGCDERTEHLVPVRHQWHGSVRLLTFGDDLPDGWGSERAPDFELRVKKGEAIGGSTFGTYCWNHRHKTN